MTSIIMKYYMYYEGFILRLTTPVSHTSRSWIRSLPNGIVRRVSWFVMALFENLKHELLFGYLYNTLLWAGASIHFSDGGGGGGQK